MAAPTLSEQPGSVPSPTTAPHASIPPTFPPPQTPMESPFIKKDMISTQLILVVMILGMILFYVGLMVLVSTVFVKAPEEPDPDDYETSEEYKKALDSYEKRLQVYKDCLRNRVGVGELLIIAGGIVESIGFFGGGVGNTEHDPKVRVALISGGVTVQIVVFIIIYIFNSMFATAIT